MELEALPSQTHPESDIHNYQILENNLVAW